jgi:hypothetical protein
MTDMIPKSAEIFDDAADLAATIKEKLQDAMTPGFRAEFTPEEAVTVGAFSEDALSEADALDAGIDLVDSE